MVVLRRETEDGQASVLEQMCLVLVALAEQTSDRELATLDPDLSSVVDGLKEHGATVGGRDESTRVFGIGDGTGIRLELAVEELVEGFCKKD
jgi:ethanolamine utilization protein EutA (predicted chaperonin)